MQHFYRAGCTLAYGPEIRSRLAQALSNMAGSCTERNKVLERAGKPQTHRVGFTTQSLVALLRDQPRGAFTGVLFSTTSDPNTIGQPSPDWIGPAAADGYHLYNVVLNSEEVNNGSGAEFGQWLSVLLAITNVEARPGRRLQPEERKVTRASSRMHVDQ